MQEMLTVHHLRRTDRDVKGGGMTKLEKLLQDPDRIIATITNDLKSPQAIPRVLIGGYCPSDFGLRDCRYCEYHVPCEDCWNEEVGE